MIACDILAALDTPHVRGGSNRPCIVIDRHAPVAADQLPCITLPYASRHGFQWTLSGPTGWHRYRVQLDAWADSAAEAESIIDRALNATGSGEAARRPAEQCELMDGSTAWRAGVDLIGASIEQRKGNWK